MSVRRPGRQHLTSAGFRLEPYAGNITAEQVLVVGPGGGKTLARDAASIADWLKAGGNLLAIGLDQQDVDFLPSKVGIRKREHIAAYFEPFAVDSPIAVESAPRTFTIAIPASCR